MASEWRAAGNAPWNADSNQKQSLAYGAPAVASGAPTRARAAALLARRLRANAATLALGALVVLGLIVRLVAAERLSLQIDEPASLLGALAVAERGVPLLPSGTLYLHGATLSYLLAPLVWLGFDSLADLQTLRVLNAAFGALAIVLTYRLGLLTSGRQVVALVAAFLLAIDPISVQWSAHLRMYALLQVLTLAIVIVFARALEEPHRIPVLMVTLFTLAAFSHIGATLLWPAMALVAAIVHGRALLAPRGLGLGVLCCLGGPLLYAALNQAFAPGVRSGTEAGISGSVLNNQGFLALENVLRPSLLGWESLFAAGWFAGLMPALLAMLCGIVAGRLLLGSEGPAELGRPRIAGALLALLWGPVLLTAVLIAEHHPRYALSIYPLALILGVIGLSLLAETGWRLRREPRGGGWIPLLAAGLVAAVMVANLGQGLVHLLQHPTIEPDYGETLAYVAQHRQADEIVLTAMTPPASMKLGGDNLAFLAGQDGSPRTTSYTQRNADGHLVDYWLGVPAIASVDQLCATLAAHPGGWVVIDEMRLHTFPAFAGSFATIIQDATSEVYRGGLNALVLRINSEATWHAASACDAT